MAAKNIALRINKIIAIVAQSFNLKEVLVDVICYEIGEINCRHRHQSIGNITCLFNARSPQLRCSVNPSGPCEGYGFYEINHSGCYRSDRP